MNELRLAGSATSALAHMALIGLAGILEDQGTTGVRLWWEDDTEASARIRTALDPEAIADAVHRHATRLARPDSWLQSTALHEGTEVGLFSPRIKAATSTESWTALLTARQQRLDTGDLTVLDHRMIGAMGEPAFWLVTRADNQPDQGASRWEMKTRNRGEDFVRNRLAPLAAVVSARSPSEVLDGLTGRLMVDELGRNDRRSRTPTGLTTPQATDNALAWCALWGMAHIWLVPQSNDMSQTAGSWPRRRVHPTEFALPVFWRPVSVVKWRTVVGSRWFDRGAFIQDATSRAWLAEQGVAAIIRFPTQIAGSRSAPERLLLEGFVEPLEG